MCNLQFTRVTGVATALLMVFGFLGVAEAGQASSTDLNCDNDGSSVRDITDAIHYASWLFLSGAQPVELAIDGTPTELLNGDCNGDGGRDFVDVLSLLFWLFGGGAEPIAPDPPVSAVLAGALPATNGVWSYGGVAGLEGAMAECEANFPGSTVCIEDQLKAAAAAGELDNVTDTTGRAVTGFWNHDPTSLPELQCGSLRGGHDPWGYGTGHLGCSGSVIGLIGGQVETALDTGCSRQFWVPCCNK